MHLMFQHVAVAVSQDHYRPLRISTSGTRDACLGRVYRFDPHPSRVVLSATLLQINMAFQDHCALVPRVNPQGRYSLWALQRPNVTNSTRTLRPSGCPGWTGEIPRTLKMSDSEVRRHRRFPPVSGSRTRRAEEADMAKPPGVWDGVKTKQLGTPSLVRVALSSVGSL